MNDRVPKAPQKNALFLLIDALRYDVLADPTARRYLVPNLARLVDRGFVRQVVTNAQSTQFVMPALFSLTYPLDYGGYNNGIRERPKSFAESIKDAGFETHLLASCNQLGVATGYGRGFDTIRTTSDFRVLLEQRIGRTLRYELTLERTADQREKIIKEVTLLLDGIEELIVHHDKSLWPPKLMRINDRVAKGCAAERALLEREPDAVMAKLTGIAPGIYWRFLGEHAPGGVRLFWHRAMEAMRWRTRGWIAAQTTWPFLMMSHFPVVFGDIVAPLCRLIESRAQTRWFIHMHAMDVHDCRALNRPGNILARARFWPRWLVGRLTGRTKRRWLYDTAVMYVDHLLGQVIDSLERTGQMEHTVVLVTGDHGLYYAESPRKKSEIGYRTHYEDIEVPLLLANSRRAPADAGMIDSMGVTATFLDALDVPPHQSFKGVSGLRSGRAFVISENCGHGNADLARRDIFFTMTTPRHKMMAVLKGATLDVKQFYDRLADPREIRNIVADPDQRAIMDEMVKLLRAERAEIFALREARNNAAA
ncbi:MAG: sulfatase-like hydrolase/transferase [Alphaproteobacteria bacterium]|nr:sulfatase-like hydrolase/transferase [Alphaproteobacteria bacterium]